MEQISWRGVGDRHFAKVGYTPWGKLSAPPEPCQTRSRWICTDPMSGYVFAKISVLGNLHRSMVCVNIYTDVRSAKVSIHLVIPDFGSAATL